MDQNQHMNRSANAPVSRNWLPVIVIVAIVVIGAVVWGMSRPDATDNQMAGSDGPAMSNENGTKDTSDDMNREEDDQNSTSDMDNDADDSQANLQHSLPSGTVIPEMHEENGVKVFTVVAGNFYFGPGEIRVKKGDKVKVVLDNKEGFHDFVIDEFNVKTKQVQGPNTQEVTFTADKAGTFEYYCSVGQHRQMGMKGQLIVE